MWIQRLWLARLVDRSVQVPRRDTNLIACAVFDCALAGLELNGVEVFVIDLSLSGLVAISPAGQYSVQLQWVMFFEYRWFINFLLVAFCVTITILGLLYSYKSSAPPPNLFFPLPLVSFVSWLLPFIFSGFVLSSRPIFSDLLCMSLCSGFSYTCYLPFFSSIAFSSATDPGASGILR